MDKERFALKALGKYPDKVRFEYHPYPYSDFGKKIAEALEAAGEQGKFWDLHDALIADTPDNDAELNSMAETAGLDMDSFTEALTSGNYRETIESAMQKAKVGGVTQVALFINGKEYRKYPGTFDDLCQAIEQELAKLEAEND